MKTIVRLFVFTAILPILAAPVLAQTQYRFEVFAAGGFPMDKDFQMGLPQYSPALQGTHSYSAGARGGIRVGADFNRNWGEDIIYSYGSNFSKIVNSTSDTQMALPVRSHQLAFNLLWYPQGVDSDTKIAPYLTAGGGGTFFALTSETVNTAREAGLGELRTENLFAFNAGGGLRVKLGKHVGIRFDGRDYMSRSPRYGLPESSTDPSALVFPASGVFHNLEASFGFVYFF
jgi:opacity protein-like surface antigen